MRKQALILSLAMVASGFMAAKPVMAEVADNEPGSVRPQTAKKARSRHRVGDWYWNGHTPVFILPGNDRAKARYRIEQEASDGVIKYTLTANPDREGKELLVREKSFGFDKTVKFKVYTEFDDSLVLDFKAWRLDDEDDDGVADDDEDWVLIGSHRQTFGKHARPVKVWLRVNGDGVFDNDDDDDDNGNNGGGSGSTRLRIEADGGDIDRVDIYRLEIDEDDEDRDVGDLVESDGDDIDEGDFADFSVTGDRWYYVEVFARNGDTFETDVYAEKGKTLSIGVQAKMKRKMPVRN